MDTITKVKKAEEDAINTIEHAQKEAAWIVTKAEEKTEKEKEKMIEKARQKFSKTLKEEQQKVNEEVNKILTDGQKQAKRIKKMVEKKKGKTVEIIINELVR